MSYETESDDDLKTGLKLWADVGIELGRKVDEQVNATRELWDALQTGTPSYYSPSASATANASGQAILDLGSPDQGTYWEVMSVVVGGVDYTTTAAGTAGLYISAGNSASSAGGMTNLIDFATALPNSAFYSTRQVWVNDQEHLLLIVNGGTSGQLYVASAAASVFQVGSSKGRIATVA